MQQQTRAKEEDSSLKKNYKPGYSPISWNRIWYFLTGKNIMSAIGPTNLFSVIFVGFYYWWITECMLYDLLWTGSKYTDYNGLSMFE